MHSHGLKQEFPAWGHNCVFHHDCAWWLSASRKNAQSFQSRKKRTASLTVKDSGDQTEEERAVGWSEKERSCGRIEKRTASLTEKDPGGQTEKEHSGIRMKESIKPAEPGSIEKECQTCMNEMVEIRITNPRL